MLKKYEIDILDVKDADAILIHFIDEHDKEYVVAIDAGRYSDGDKVADFIRKYYRSNVIDMAICTHCDDDHYGGFIKIIEDQMQYPYFGIKIQTLCVNDPGKFVKASDVKYYRNNTNVKAEARTVYTLSDGDKNLLEIASSARIPIRDAFSWGGDDYNLFGGVIEIIGPTKDYYSQLAPELRHNLEPYDTTEDNEDDTSLEYGKCISPKLDATNDDPSTHNQSSVIVLFKPNSVDKFVFMGDAGRAAYNNMIYLDREKMKDSVVLKVPHHGSKYNIDSTMINFINPKIAIVSAKSNEKYFSPYVKNALKRKGALVYCTMCNGNLWYNNGFEEREGYTPAVPQ